MRSKASPVRRRSSTDPGGIGVTNPGATPSSAVESGVQPCDRQAGVGLSAFTHRFPPGGGQRGRTPHHPIRTGRGRPGGQGRPSPPSCGGDGLEPAASACRRCPSACDPAIPAPPSRRWRLGARHGLAMPVGSSSHPEQRGPPKEEAKRSDVPGYGGIGPALTSPERAFESQGWSVPANQERHGRAAEIRPCRRDPRDRRRCRSGRWRPSAEIGWCAWCSVRSRRA